MMRKPLSPITLTDAAADRVKALLARHDGAAAGLRIGVKSKGCSGLSYNIEYADAKGPHDEVVEDKGVTIFIDPKATMFILGSEVDYERTSCNPASCSAIRTRRAAAAAANR